MQNKPDDMTIAGYVQHLGDCPDDLAIEIRAQLRNDEKMDFRVIRALPSILSDMHERLHRQANTIHRQRDDIKTLTKRVNELEGRPTPAYMLLGRLKAALKDIDNLEVELETES